MYDRILNRMREAIRTRNYVMTLHAEEEMNDDNLSIFDVERINWLLSRYIKYEVQNDL
jgi:hypothetical protein